MVELHWYLCATAVIDSMYQFVHKRSDYAGVIVPGVRANFHLPRTWIKSPAFFIGRTAFAEWLRVIALSPPHLSYNLLRLGIGFQCFLFSRFARVEGGLKVAEKRRFEIPSSSGWIFFRHSR
jgi:hypothetical protein